MSTAQRPEFSLRRLATEVWDEMDGCEYHVLAKELARRIRPADREAALGEALVQWAYAFNTTVGHASPPGTGQGEGAGQQNSGRSRKVAAIRADWQRRMTRHISTADGQKAIGDCTAEDLIFNAEVLETLASANQRKAAWERRLAAAVEEHGAGCVRELPDEALAEFFAHGEDAA